MLLQKIKAAHFRNLTAASLTPVKRFNVFAGANAQGKTNLLEAIYLVAYLSSWRAGRNSEMVQFGAEEARVMATAIAANGISREIEISLQTAGRRRIRIDGKAPVASYGSGLNVVLFTPEDLNVPRGAPKARRSLLDRAVATIWSGYYQLARDYQRALQSRNKLLSDRQNIDEQLLNVYDQQLSELGAKIVAARVRYLAGLAPLFREVFQEIHQGAGQGSLVYLCKEEVRQAGDKIEALRETLRGLLWRARSMDLARKATSIGPHTDDLDFRLDERTTRAFGSQGQVRLLILAFKIAQILDAREKLGHYPLLLLDDMSSELDEQRSKYLLDFIDKIECQAFITTTRPEILPLSGESQYYQIDRGNIFPLQRA